MNVLLEMFTQSNIITTQISQSSVLQLAYKFASRAPKPRNLNHPLSAPTNLTVVSSLCNTLARLKTLRKVLYFYYYDIRIQNIFTNSISTKPYTSNQTLFLYRQMNLYCIVFRYYQEASKI